MKGAAEIDEEEGNSPGSLSSAEKLFFLVCQLPAESFILLLSFNGEAGDLLLKLNVGIGGCRQ